MKTALGLTVMAVVFGALALAGLAATFRQWTRPIFALLPAVYLIVLALWDPIVQGPLPGNDAPWIYYLCNVATGFAVVASGRRWAVAAAYTIATPIVVALIRAEPDGGGASWSQAALDGLYCLLLGAVILVIAVALRQAAASVDSAQSQALERYSAAVRSHATEAERVTVDALVHDSVLTTLLSAARARSADSMALAAQMARNALGHLAKAQSSFPGAEHDVSLGVVAGRIRLAVAEQPALFEVHVHDLSSRVIPESVSSAVVSAATQAMVNSVNHAGSEPVRRSVTMRGLEGGVSVVIEDDGAGFDLGAIAPGRLGVRTSILERMSSLGGVAEITTAPGEGVRVELRWPARPESEQPEGDAAVSADAAGWSE
jgi:signal transduction histidine kinase